LLSGRRDIIVVSSVSCLYGIGNPVDFHEKTTLLHKGQRMSRSKLLHQLVEALYHRNELEFKRGTFRVKGDTVDVFLAYDDYAFRILFWDDEIEEIYAFDPLTGRKLENFDEAKIFPANIFVTTQERIQRAIREIQDDMMAQVAYFKEIGKYLEAKRLKERVEYDLEMIRELGYCSGIENYSRYFDGRAPGSRPFCLLDYFPSDFVTIIDESHVTIPQIRAMYGGDHSRKQNLVEFGFRLPAAIDNRPLTFAEFEGVVGQTIYVSATPADYELTRSEGVVVEQLIRPTGLLDPEIEVKPSLRQIDDLVENVLERARRNERVLVTTLTKKMAEELTDYFGKVAIRARYIHSDVDTLDRVTIMEDLRAGSFDVLVGVNLLREGLDLPEVSLVAILDADKEGFLRSARALTQTAGRAARNINGKVIMYADRITDSMAQTIQETERRRRRQMEYNQLHNIQPRQIEKALTSIMGDRAGVRNSDQDISKKEYQVADPATVYTSRTDLERAIDATKREMHKAAKDLEFLEAARLRDEMYRLEKQYKALFTNPL
ncbi:MAG: excinuclease ABC subunit UvrB, partial [Bacteroidales bacterium]